MLLLALATPSSASDTRVIEALKSGRITVARALIQQRVDVKAALPDGTTALHWAAEIDDLDLVRALIAAGADVNAASAFGVTPLWLACQNGNAAVIAVLVRAGANPNQPLPSGETPLMTASRTGRPDAVSVLLEAGANVSAKETVAGQTPLMWAIAEGHREVVKVLLKAGASAHEPSRRGFTPLLFAARTGDIEIAKMLIAAGVDVNETARDGTTALVIATIRSNVPLSTFLLDAGANPNLGPGFTPLHWVVGDWTSELAGEKTNARPEGTEWDQLLPLPAGAREEFITLLLSHGADVNARARAVPRATVGIGGGGGGMGMGIGVGAGSAPRVTRLSGATPFLIAAQHSDLPLMRFLLSKGADPSIRTDRNVTALMAAAGVDSGESSGYTGVPEADALAAVKLCLELGNDPKVVSTDGENALHGAAYRGNAGGNQLAALLIDLGVEVGQKNKRGWTPVTLAEGIYTQNSNSKNPELEQLLLAHGGRPSPPNIERDAYAVIVDEP
ncbi:MAG TPA: ankyrin repeat domain-containing protein [Vicinamibacterales bacterium]|nr:ankyrin repeat domain-containing protein [Vicinamibacterales bacterium]